MKKQLLPLLLFFSLIKTNLNGQNNCNQILGATYAECFEGSEINLISNICQENELELIMHSEFISPISMCDIDNSVLNNPNYYTFIADGSAPFSIIVTPIPGTCTEMGGVFGIQAALVGVGDCNTLTPFSIPCQAECSTLPVFLETKFIPTNGQLIVLLLDGCNGTVCNLNFEILSGWNDSLIIPDDEELNESIILAESDVNCSNFTLTLDPPFEGICDYRWTFPDGSVQDVSSSQINVDVSNFPDGTICVQGYSDGCYPGELFPTENTICYDYSAKDFPETEVGSESTTCGKNDGVAFVEVSGEGPFQYEWSNGATDSSIVNVDAGMYFVTVTDGLGCEQVDSIEVIASDEISSEVEIVHPDCNGSLGRISLMNLGGSGDFDYSWSPIVNTESSADSLAVGEFFITVTDSNDPTCFQVISVELILDDNLEMTIEEIQGSLAVENTGSVSIEVNFDSEFNYALQLPEGAIKIDTISGNSLEFNELGIGLHQLILEEILSGCRDTLEFEIELISSILESEINGIVELHVFPNPVSNILYFKEKVIGDLFQIYTLDGKIIHSDILDENHLHLKTLNPGVYILIVENAIGVKKMAKLVKVE